MSQFGLENTVNTLKMCAREKNAPRKLKESLLSATFSLQYLDPQTNYPNKSSSFVIPDVSGVFACLYAAIRREYMHSFSACSYYTGPQPLCRGYNFETVTQDILAQGASRILATTEKGWHPDFRSLPVFGFLHSWLLDRL